MILNYYDKKINYDNLKSEFKMDEVGTSAYEVIRVAKKHGLNAEGYKNFKINKSLHFPVIAHVVNNNLQHFVVVLKVFKEKILIADPARGVMEILKKDFAKTYTGIAIVFSDEIFSIKHILFKNKYIVPLFIIALILSIYNLLSSYLLSIISEQISNNKTIYWVILFFITGIIKELFSYLKDNLFLKFKIKTDKTITIPTISKIITLPHKFYQKSGSGELISKINDLSYVKNLIFEFTDVFLINVVIIIISFIFISIISYKLLLINILISILLFMVNKTFHNKNFYKTYDLQLKSQGINALISDVITCIYSVKNLSKEHYFTNKITNKYNDFLKNFKSLSKIYYKKDLLFKIINVITYTFVMLILIFDSSNISLTIFSFYMQMIIFDSLNSIFSLQPLYTNYKSTIKRLDSIYKEKSIASNGEKININKIEFKNLNYKYNDKMILKNVSFSFKKGDLIMINGPTGVGKSTLFKLLTKQLKPPKNKIYINDDDISTINSLDIRKSIIYVDQKTRLFNDTIKENISFNKDIKVRNSFKQLLDDILNKNFIDYNYLVDNINSNLSGGQMELIIIAQALNNNCDVYIFDETTSQLDQETEKRVLKAIKKDYPDKIIILISHRKTNLNLFNKIIEFNSDKKVIIRRSNEEFKK